jgi:hypothetical protein
MLRSDPAIDFRSALTARGFQAVFPLMSRLQYSSPEVQFATKPIAKPATIKIPTRHGQIKALVYRPTDEDIAAAKAAGQRPPVHFITHGVDAGELLVGDLDALRGHDGRVRHAALRDGGARATTASRTPSPPTSQVLADHPQRLASRVRGHDGRGAQRRGRAALHRRRRERGVTRR